MQPPKYPYHHRTSKTPVHQQCKQGWARERDDKKVSSPRPREGDPNFSPWINEIAIPCSWKVLHWSRITENSLARRLTCRWLARLSPDGANAFLMTGTLSRMYSLISIFRWGEDNGTRPKAVRSSSLYPRNGSLGASAPDCSGTWSQTHTVRVIFLLVVVSLFSFDPSEAVNNLW